MHARTAGSYSRYTVCAVATAAVCMHVHMYYYLCMYYQGRAYYVAILLFICNNLYMLQCICHALATALYSYTLHTVARTGMMPSNECVAICSLSLQAN